MKSYTDIPGYFDYPYIYSQIADQVRDGGTIVEVGSWLGQSMAYMGQRLQARGWKGRLVAIDGFTGELNQPDHAEVIAKHGGTIRAAFDQNMADCGLAEMVEVIQGDSAVSANRLEDGTVDFCFIDAAHDHDSVCRDIAAWLPKMREGGVIAGHDYPHHEVGRAVLEYLGSTSYQVFGSCWYKHMPLGVPPQQWREGMKLAKEILAREHAKKAHVTSG